MSGARYLWIACGFPWLVLAVALLSPLITPEWDLLTPDLISILVVFYALFYGFVLFGLVSFGIAHSVRLDARSAVLILVCAVFCAALLRAYDVFILRPIPDWLSFSAIREARLEGESGVVSTVSRILFITGLVAYGQVRRACEDRFWPRVAGVPVVEACLWLQVVYVFATGSRGILIIALLLLCYQYLRKENIGIIALTGTVAFVVLFLYRFASRATGDEGDALEHLVVTSVYGYGLFVPPSPWVLSVIGEENLLSGVVFGLLHINQYLAHGVFEFGYLYEYANDQFRDLSVFGQLARVAGQDAESEIVRGSFYYSLAGSAYASLGSWYWAFAVFAGLLYGAAVRAAARVSPGATLVVLWGLSLVPFVNSVGGFDFLLFLGAIILVGRFMVVPSPSSPKQD